MSLPSIGFPARSLALWTAAILVAALSASNAAAQAVSTGCFGGQPLPCKAYLVFDMIASGTIAGNSAGGGTVNDNGDIVPSHTRTYIGWETGGMKNITPTYAIGLTAEAGFIDFAGPRVAIKARERTWLAKGKALDVAVGGVRERIRDPEWTHTDCGTCDSQQYGLTADATWGTHTLGITAGADAVSGYGRTNTVLRIGVRAGGLFGLGSTAVAAVSLAAWVGMALLAMK